MDKTEKTAVESENEEVQKESEETSATEEDTSKEETTKPEQESEAPEAEKDEVEAESDFEEAVKKAATPLAQSMSDKAQKANQEKIAELTKDRDNWKLQATEKLIDRKLARYTEEYDEKDLDDKKKEQLKAEDQAFKKLVLEYEKDKAEVNKLKPELEQKENVLGMIERDFNAREEVWSLLFPEDKDKIAKVKTYVERFAKAEDVKDFENILDVIRQEVKLKSKPFKADSSKPGGGGIDLSKLSSRELLVLGEKRKKK